MAGSVEVRQRRNRSRKRPLTTCNANDIDVSSIDLTDLSQLKEVSQRLNLSTRRPSTIQWKQVIELRKSMGLYGSSGDVDEIAGVEFSNSVTDLDVQNGHVPPTRPYSLYVPKQSFSSPASSDDDITKSITISVPTDMNGNKILCNSNSLAAPQQNDDPKKLLLISDNLQIGKSQRQFESNDLDIHSIQTDAHNGEIHVDKFKPSGLDSVHLPALPPDLVNDQVQDSLRMFCDVDDEFDDDFTSGINENNVRYYTITKVLRKIRRDLITMRIEDNRLARNLLETRSRMNFLKLTQSCDKHAEMLDDVAYEMEEEDMMPGLIKACDLPGRPPESILSAFSPLRHIGVSRMNLNRRRFSIR